MNYRHIMHNERTYVKVIVDHGALFFIGLGSLLIYLHGAKVAKLSRHCKILHRFPVSSRHFSSSNATSTLLMLVHIAHSTEMFTVTR